MLTEIERRINENHPESIASLAREVREVFAPVINALNVGITLLQDQFADNAQLETVLEKLVTTIAANKAETLEKLDALSKRMEQIEIDQKDLAQGIATLVKYLQEGNNGESE